jgi:hypothetical protein
MKIILARENQTNLQMPCIYLEMPDDLFQTGSAQGPTSQKARQSLPKYGKLYQHDLFGSM